MKKTCFLLTIGLALTFVHCKNDKPTSKPKLDVVVSNIDSTVNPADDFFAFANGGWLKRNPIPETESNWGIGNMVQEDILEKVKKISKNAAASTNTVGSNAQKIGDFWASGMDSVGIEKAGLKPLKPELDKIHAIKTIQDVLSLAAQWHTVNIQTIFNVGVYQDLKNSDKYALYLGQGGLGLPDRDYYFDKKNDSIRIQYAHHIATILKLSGDSVATVQQKAASILKLETALASSSRRLEALRDPQKNYNKLTVKGLQAMTPSISWLEMLHTMNIVTDTVIVGQPEFFRTVESLLKTTPIEDWKNYLRWQLLTQLSDKLPTAFEQADFNFFDKVLSGKKSMKPRWKRVLNVQEKLLGDALGQLFVKDFFNENAKKRYNTMTDNVIAAFRERIKSSEWMSATTKTKALDKLSKVVKKVGYPDKWKDFSTMKMDRSSYVGNTLSAQKWWYQYRIGKLGKPVDRTEWDMTPQTYNAYYNPSNNEIVLPAAIFLIPGYTDAEIDDAVAYGYGGASTIGHEITHGFDDEGRQFDEKGNLKSWWTPADETQFKSKAQNLVKQFDGYIAVDTIHVRGQACLGENIADLGGVVLGFEAFKKTEQFQKNEKILGYSPDQRYFMGYALGWMTQARKEKLKMQVMTDVHAPAFLRVNGPFSNVLEFYNAFNVQPTHKMYRHKPDRVVIW
jgi:putative endopeptidase